MVTEDRIKARYRVTRLVGQGAMGEVYEAEQTALRRRVALKVMRPHVFQDPEARRRFVQEAKLLARLSHPNLVTVFDADLDGERPYIAMEFVEGVSLDTLLRERKRLSSREAIQIARGILGGLSELHANKVIHRDLKPPNVLMEGKRSPRIADFGLARYSDSARLTAEGFIVGTPIFMSPEQLLAKEPTPAADVFAFGVMLFLMLTGEHPWVAASAEALLIQKLDTPPSMLRERLGELPAALADFTVRCLAADPGERPADGARALEALEEAAQARPPTRSAPVVRVPTAPAAPRRRWPWALAGALAIASAVAALRPAAAPEARVEAENPAPPTREELLLDIERDTARQAESVNQTANLLEKMQQQNVRNAATVDPVKATDQFHETIAREIAGTGKLLLRDYFPNRAGCRAEDWGPRLIARLVEVVRHCRSKLAISLEHSWAARRPQHIDLKYHTQLHHEFRLEMLIAGTMAPFANAIPKDVMDESGPRWTAAAALLLAVQRPQLKGKELAAMEQRFTELVRRAAAGLADPKRAPLRASDERLMRRLVDAIEMMGVKRTCMPILRDALARSGATAGRGVDPALLIMACDIQFDSIEEEMPTNEFEIDFRERREALLPRAAALRDWVIASWPWDPRQKMPKSFEHPDRDDLDYDVGVRLIVLRMVTSKLAKSVGVEPPPEPAARPSGAVR